MVLYAPETPRPKDACSLFVLERSLLRHASVDKTPSGSLLRRWRPLESFEFLRSPSRTLEFHTQCPEYLRNIAASQPSWPHGQVDALIPEALPECLEIAFNLSIRGEVMPKFVGVTLCTWRVSTFRCRAEEAQGLGALQVIRRKQLSVLR